MAKKASRTSNARGSRNAKAARPASNRSEGGAAARIASFNAEDLLATQVLEEIESGPGLDVTAIDLLIRSGEAEVRGAVSDEEEKEELEQIIGESGGINTLVSHLVVSPARVEVARDQARRLQELLDKDPDLCAEGIQVACVGKRIILRGVIQSPVKRAKAALLALRNQDGEARLRVRNRLVLMTPSL